jgi:aryl-alcohol dehydrogenase-like predicted oxidoreductase
MEYRRLGASNLEVSSIALGSWLTYSGGIDRTRSIACIRRALDLGVTLFDTANIYGRGVAETVLAEALAGVPRQSYVLATKLFFPMTETDRGLSRAQIRKQLDASLQRLRTDYVDLYQCHRHDPETPLEETMAALGDAVRAGKVRHIGFSEWPVEAIRAALAIPGAERFVSSQPQYSMLWREPERAVIPLCRSNGIAQIVWSPLAQGILTGKYRPGVAVPAGSRAGSTAMGGFIRREWLSPRMLEAVARLGDVARGQGLTTAQFALAWVLREPNVAAAIVGATRPEQVEENVAAAGRTVDPAAFAEAERLLDAALRS